MHSLLVSHDYIGSNISQNMVVQTIKSILLDWLDYDAHAALRGNETT